MLVQCWVRRSVGSKKVDGRSTHQDHVDHQQGEGVDAKEREGSICGKALALPLTPVMMLYCLEQTE